MKGIESNGKESKNLSQICLIKFNTLIYVPNCYL